MKLSFTARLAAVTAVAAGALVSAPGPAQASAIHPDGFPFPSACSSQNSADVRYNAGTEIGSGTAICIADSEYTLAYELVDQSDGNLVIYNEVGQAIWASNTDIHANTLGVMEFDGNFEVVRTTGPEVWSSNTSGHGGAYVCFQRDGNLVVYAPGGNCSGTALWASGT